jgi:hypothetical protein
LQGEEELFDEAPLHQEKDKEKTQIKNKKRSVSTGVKLLSKKKSDTGSKKS